MKSKTIRRGAKYVTVFFMIILMSWLYNAAADLSIGLEVPIFEQSKILQLPQNTESLWFLIPRNTHLITARLNLHLSASDTILDEQCAISMVMNNDFIATRRIRSIIEESSGIWDVNIPVNTFRNDGKLNELTFHTMQQSIEGVNADSGNLANWLKLHEDSFLILNGTNIEPPILSDTYIHFFDSFENMKNLSADFILGAMPEDTELEAMLSIASAIGSVFPYRDDVITRVTAEEDSTRDNQIHVGLVSSSHIKAQNVPELSSGEGYLSIYAKDNNNQMLITGKEKDGLSLAAAFFGNRELLSQADQHNLIIKDSGKKLVRTDLHKDSGFYAFSDFGYDTVNLNGALSQAVMFELQQRSGLQCGDNSYVEIHFRHSEALISEKSLITVYINGTPLGSAKLSPGNADGGRIKVKLPQKAREQEKIYVKIEVHHYLGKEDNSIDYSNIAWTVIQSDSAVYFEPGEYGILPILSNFPMLSCGSSDIVLISQKSAASLAAALAIRVGQQNDAQFSWHYEDINSLNNPNPNADYFIVVDNNHAPKLPEQINKALFISPSAADRFLISQGINTKDSILSNKVVIQVIRSPWNYDHRVFMISYPQGGESIAQRIIQSRDILNELSGQISVYSASGITTPLSSVMSETYDKPPLTFERIVYLVETKTGYPAEVILVLLTAILVIIMLIIRITRNKERFSKAANNMQKENAEKEHKAAIDPESTNQIT